MTQDVHSGPGDLAPGDQLADYQIQGQIGRGGMAVVYRALDLRLGRLVALKVMAPHLGADEAFRQRFIRESRAAAGVDHPHIVPVFDAGEADGVLFIAMRYVGYGDVRSLIEAEGGGLGASRVANIASQVASALDAAHAHGLVHRDVKPGNMLLGQSGDGSDHVYLSDFGLSKHSLAPSTLTSTGQFLGTLDYVSPEQIQGQPVDGRADQYALACAVIEMLTGSPPFSRDDTMALMWAQLEAPPPRLTERRPDLPRAIDRVVATALSKSPANRYPTCRAFAMALSAACAEGLHADDVAAEPAQPSQPPPAHLGHPAPRHPMQPQTKADAMQDNGHRPDAQQDPYAAPPAHVTRAPTDRLRSPHMPPTTPQQAFKETRPARADRQSPARGRPAKRRQRNVLMAALIILVGVAAITGIGYKLFYHPHAPAARTAGRTTSPSPAVVQRSPSDTVLAYFKAINDHDYRTAWLLANKRGRYKAFVAGFAGTAKDTVKIVSTSGNLVSAQLIATQTDGTVKTFAGTYTVVGGVITAANVHQQS